MNLGLEKIRVPLTGKSEKKEIGVWERVFGEVINHLPEEYKQKAMTLQNDINFKLGVKKLWDQRTLEENVNNDPIKQESIWAKDLAKKIIERFDV